MIKSEKVCLICGTTVKSNIAVCPNDGNPLYTGSNEGERFDPLANIVPGFIISERYEVLARISTDDKVALLSARHISTDTPIWLKILTDTDRREMAEFWKLVKQQSSDGHPDNQPVDIGITADGYAYMVLKRSE